MVISCKTRGLGLTVQALDFFPMLFFGSGFRHLGLVCPVCTSFFLNLNEI